MLKFLDFRKILLYYIIYNTLYYTTNSTIYYRINSTIYNVNFYLSVYLNGFVVIMRVII